MKKPNSRNARKKQQRVDLLLTGTGSLAKSILLGWPSGKWREPRRVMILGRSQSHATELAAFANLRAAAANCRLECTGASTTWQEADLREHIEKTAPRLVIHTASLQSPWAKGDESSAWRISIKQFGYGLTTVLHSALALRIGRVLATASTEPAYVNCCYPDAVNPLLTRAGVPVVCGSGNVGIVEAVWRSVMPSQDRIRILAHHAHLVQLFRPGSGAYPRVWIGAKECERVAEILGKIRLPADNTLNAVTGTVTANLAEALLGREPVHTHAPAPLGLPGGYPILARAGRVKLDLPHGLTASEAAAFIESAQVAEGIISIGDAGLRYTQPLAEQLKRHGGKFSSGFAPDQIDEAVADMLQVRQKLGGTEA